MKKATRRIAAAALFLFTMWSAGKAVDVMPSSMANTLLITGVLCLMAIGCALLVIED